MEYKKVHVGGAVFPCIAAESPKSNMHFFFIFPRIFTGNFFFSLFKLLKNEY